MAVRGKIAALARPTETGCPSQAVACCSMACRNPSPEKNQYTAPVAARTITTRTQSSERTILRISGQTITTSDVPELPDILLYLHALRPRVIGRQVERVRLASPFLLRSVDPPLTALDGRTIVDLHRLGKRVVFEAERELFLVFHLMIAGRFRWKPAGKPIPGKIGLLAMDFAHGTLVMTEAGTKRQASLYVVQGRDALDRHNPGGLEVLEASQPSFAEALTAENHTLKRA